MSSSINNYFEVLRTHHWIKNLFIFIPPFFAGVIFSEELMIELLLGFLSFSLITSSIYIFNDIRDIAFDKLHPIKKNRPFASSKVNVRSGYIIMSICLISGILISFYLPNDFIMLAVFYILLNALYSMGLKSIPILDLFIVSFGFVIRIFLGGTIAEVEVSDWLVIMIFLLSLFLVLTKRKDDLEIKKIQGDKVRKALNGYNDVFIDACITMTSGIIIVSYLMYCFSDNLPIQWHQRKIYFTSVFVIAGLMRYLQLTLVEKKSGSPVKILYTDKFILSTVLLWITSFLIIIYL